MPNLSDRGAELLRHIATEVNRVPGALDGIDIGELLAAGLVTFGAVPVGPAAPGEDAWKQPMMAKLWVTPTPAGTAWLVANK